MSIEIDGFDELERNLDKLQKNLEKLEGEHEVPASKLITDAFIRSHSNFQTLQAFFDAGGIESSEDIGTEAFDQFVAGNTDFDGWEDMFKAAGTDYAVRQLEL